MRNLTKTIAAVSLLVPASAYSLGIGDIKLHSALNQTLEAEIALLVSEGENISDLRVRLAPPEKFDEAGIPWSYFLSKIKFVPVMRPDGSAMVKVSSQEVLKEPFLDFLVEVSWDKGSLYREFTVLVDPPVVYTQPVIPVVQKVEQVSVAPAAPIIEKKSVSRASLAKEIMDGSSIQRDGKYGPIRRNESLWKIAETTNSNKDISIEQMMMAIYEANQTAFYGNVNSLKAGQILDIPKKEAVLKWTKKQAKVAFIQQTEEWLGHSVAKANNQSLQVASKTKPLLDLKAPVEGEIAETTIVVSENDVPADQAAELESESSVTALSEEGLALQARMTKLEQQLEMMQKMLVLKDEQITVLQKELNRVPSDLKTSETTEDPKLEQKKEAIKEQPLEGDVKATVEPTKVIKPTADKQEPAVEKQKELQKEPESDWEFPVMSAIAIPLLGALGWMFWRRKKNNEEIEAESMFSSASGVSLPDSSEQVTIDGVDNSEAETTSGFEGVPADESSLIGEFDNSDFNSFYAEQSEVDPVLEADVYLAYGRHQQAEELMLQAISDQPDRDECKLKLLEVYQADENKNAFEKYTTELLNAGRHDDEEFWGKVVEMGTKLNIEPGLLGKSVGEKAHFDLNDAGEDVTSQVDNKLAESNDDALPEESVVAEEPSVETANEMEFDLSIFDEDEEDLNLEIKEKDDNGIDFDLSQFDLDDSENEPVEPDSKDTDLDLIVSESEKDLNADKGTETDEIESFDFDLDAKAELDAAADLSSETELSKFDFNELSSNLASEQENENFTLGTDTLDSESKDEEIGVSGLTDEDELETKIDLAKAYIDMEDTDSAKAIAEEVLEKGNEKQKQEAKEIIKQLD